MTLPLSPETDLVQPNATACFLSFLLCCCAALGDCRFMAVGALSYVSPCNVVAWVRDGSCAIYLAKRSSKQNYSAVASADAPSSSDKAVISIS
jgi:hypothetical protein